MAAAPVTAGSAYFTYKTGKVGGPFNATYGLVTVKDGYYLDVSKGGKDYPTKLDFGKFKTVSEITFKPHMGKQSSWTSWTYWNNGQWAVDRFTNLG